MKIIIIGGSGFIGTRLCNRLYNLNNVEFLILDKQMSKFFPQFCKIVDIRDYDKLKENIENCDVLINLAAEHRDDVRPKSLYDEVNVDGARNVIKVCKEKNINKIIFTSSVAVYGFAEPDTDENGKINYFNDYGRTKWEAEEIYREWFNENPKERNLIIIRPTVVFGERNRGNVYNLLKQINSGLFFIIGNGKNIKSMAYVENVAAFIEYCIFNINGYKLYNYVDKPDIDMNTLIKLVFKLLKKDSLLNKIKLKIRIPYFFGLFIGYIFDFLSFITKKKFSISSIRIKKFCSTTKFNTSISKDTGFIPPVSLIDGLTKTIEFEFINKKNSKYDDFVFISE